MAVMLLKIASGSMMPCLVEGQVVSLELADTAFRPEPGDVLAMRDKDGVLVLHRCLRLLDDGRVITRGDNSLSEDVPWSSSQVFGRVVGLQVVKNQWLVPNQGIGKTIAWGQRNLPRFASRALQYAVRSRTWLEGSRMPLPETLIPVSAMAAEKQRWEVQQLGNEWAIYDNRTGDVHLLNKTAQQIWEKCRAGLDKHRILNELSCLYPGISRDVLEKDIAETLKLLKDTCLLDEIS